MADPAPHVRGRRLVPTAMALAAPALLLAAGVAGWPGTARPDTHRLDTPGLDTAASVIATVAAVPAPSPAAGPARSMPGAPRRIVVPALGLDAPVDPIRLADTTLVPPADPTRVGWWADGARPGDRLGSALLTGHTLHRGGGVFDRLDEVGAGDTIEVRGRRGGLAFVVRSVTTLSRESVARRHAQLFRQRGPGRLVLVTCEDWDGRAFLSSVVVVAEPVA